MKLLIITQKVDISDDLLGFFHEWLKEFSQKVEKVQVITLSKGEYHLPDNVEVFTLGKENGRGRIARYFQFYRLLFQLLPKTDKVLAHMCPEYIVAMWPVNLFFRKDLFLWYVHRQTSTWLKLSEHMVKKIFTASAESLSLNTPKKVILGHGIKVENLRPTVKKNIDKFKIIYVGRISPIKNQLLLLKAADALVKHFGFKEFLIELIGQPIMPDDFIYIGELEKFIREKELDDYVEFVGKIPYKSIVQYYQQADLSVNLSPTGGLDKTVLESMAAGIPVIVLNQSFGETLGVYRESLILPEADEQVLVKKLWEIINFDDQDKEILSEYLIKQVGEHHHIINLINDLVKEMA